MVRFDSKWISWRSTKLRTIGLQGVSAVYAHRNAIDWATSRRCDTMLPTRAGPVYMHIIRLFISLSLLWSLLSGCVTDPDASRTEPEAEIGLYLWLETPVTHTLLGLFHSSLRVHLQSYGYQSLVASAKTGVRLQFETAKSIPEFEKRCNEGLYDLAYMNYHYTVFHETAGYEAFAKQAEKQIQGILVKRKDAPMNTLEALRGTQLAFPAPRAFAATLLTRAALDAKGVSYTPNFVSSHDSVYPGVAKGLFPAGGGIVRTFKGIEPSIQQQLQDLLENTDVYTPHAFAIHPRVPADVRQAIVSEFLALDDTDVGRELLTPP